MGNSWCNQYGAVGRPQQTLEDHSTKRWRKQRNTLRPPILPTERCQPEYSRQRLLEGPPSWRVGNSRERSLRSMVS